jgi:hypothetical protein
MKRYMALGAVLVALGAGGAALGQKAAAGGATAAQNDGGLSVLPAVVEHGPQPGPLGTYTIANRSAAPLAVTVTPRPWVQATSGKVSVNRRAKLAGVSIDAPTFTLAPGAQRNVVATLTTTPSAGSLYGAMEVVGLPADAATRKGVVLGYRIIGTVRVVPTSPRIGLVAGKPKARKGTAVLSIRNSGNTAEPLSGSVTLRSAAGSRTRSVASLRILPGKSVSLPLGTRLTSGRYTATLRLVQRGRVALRTTKRFTVK